VPLQFVLQVFLWLIIYTAPFADALCVRMQYNKQCNMVSLAVFLGAISDTSPNSALDAIAESFSYDLTVSFCPLSACVTARHISSFSQIQCIYSFCRMRPSTLLHSQTHF